MKAPQDKKFIAGIDIGSTHTTVVVGQNEPVDSKIDAQNADKEKKSHHFIPAPKFNLLGMARASNSGMRRGGMVNLDAVTTSLLEALDEIERQTGVDVESVRVSVANTAALSDNYTESISVRNNEVKAADLEKLSSTVRGQKPPQGNDFIHLIPGQFILDGKSGILNPLGMYGTSLASIYHRVTFPQADLHNIIRACNNAGLRVQSVAYEGLSASQAVLDEDEKELGVCCISMGASLTHVAVYSGGLPVFSKDYPIGSHHITKDLAIGLRTTQTEAERVKRDYGQALYNPMEASEQLEVSSTDSTVLRLINKGQVSHIIEPRVREILSTVHADLKRVKLLGFITKGLVLTGGGSLLNGVCLVAEDVFGLQTRIGHPLGVGGVLEGIRSPNTSAAVGLLSPLFANVHASRTLNRAIQSNSQGISGFARSFWDRLVEPFV